MLALLPDNTAGAISPADLRAIVTELYEMAASSSQAYPFRWASGGAPDAGHVTMDQPWQMFASKALVSETADDGTALGFALLDGAVASRVWITGPSGQLVADVTGPSVDVGGYREVPIGVRSISGDQPGDNSAVTVSLVVVL